ncbi:MAG: glutamate synthase large subunit, partial [Verrucomicrobia bacterium]|nr:glutamate synthase large subunit [Verrucomicrobiota bacterium]
MSDNRTESLTGRKRGMPSAQGLYDSRWEHDACGVGFLANIRGEKNHEIIQRGIEVLNNLHHRGAAGADIHTGDGAGLLIQMPDRFMRARASELNFTLPEEHYYGVAMIFMPQNEDLRRQCVKDMEKVVSDEGLNLLGWREVPTNSDVLGVKAKEREPHVMQCFVSSDSLRSDALDRKLYVVRRLAEKAAEKHIPPEDIFYIPSFSTDTIIFKGLMLPSQVVGYYEDLKDPMVESALCIVHQRYSTNTFPSWELAQPFRYLAHNGEINTLRGNTNWMRSREKNFKSDLFGDDIKKIIPVINESGSDSACLDNALELIINGGRELHHSMMMLIPQAWGSKYPMGPDLRGFFEYHAGLMEPWDGPAAVAFTNGKQIGAMLDRNGLRPARYTVTKDGFMVFASEAGVLDIPADQVAEKGALRPGQMLLVDLGEKRLLKDYEIKMRLARLQPYRRWVEENKIDIHGFFNAVGAVKPETESLTERQLLFGYTREDIEVLLKPMATTGHEPVGSMGADQALAVLSDQPQLLYWYFKQLFAQVTNPAIDPIREELVMSLMTFIGNPENILEETPLHARLIKLKHPILSNEDLNRIEKLNHEHFRSKRIPISFGGEYSGNDLAEAIENICNTAEAAVRHGLRLLILSDRDLPEGELPIPALLAVSAVNQRLRRAAKRASVGIIVETGEAREVMHMALLLGYGATAINPYLAFETISDLRMRDQIPGGKSPAKHIENYVKALCKGLLKVMSKMGISTLRSYRNAQVFEAIGLKQELVDRYFEGTSSRVEGIGLNEIAAEILNRYRKANERAQADPPNLLPGGQYKYRPDGERHLWTPLSISYLQRACRENDYEVYRQYAALINDQTERQCTLRGLFKFKETTPIPIEEVESIESILPRFATGAMSFGSISREAHETLAIAMNRFGGMSNSGEGGEDPARFIPLPNGDSKCSAVKQIASGRFGVTAEYLVNGRELQIKIAQGAKPGEGGQLPGHKVNQEIARVRNSTPGVSLISPPPHHDIYSIEDIAQLIYDLKNANPEARISVKLVSEIGVGTVAAGLSKGHADMVLISGYDGGTGASPLSSLKHAGMPWELGLAEAQQTLVLNDLRDRVRLQVDGQIKTGRDVVIGALLGAEEFGSATAALVVMGCIMMRVCHLNTCPVGIATQDAQLRKTFAGSPDHVVNFFRMMSQEIRELMAQLGFRTMDEMIGRSDMLEMNGAIDFWKAKGVDISKILHRVPSDPSRARKTVEQDHGIDKALDYEILPQVLPSIETGQKVTVEMPVRNVHRTVGTIVSSHIARKYGSKGLPDDTITLNLTGAAGQSFAAFCSRGMTFHLRGEANDYLGKGLSGAKVIVNPYPDCDFDPSKNIIAGNVLLYGATAGEVYLHGQAGERFCIRNSGAKAVVEGVGDHGCEYMTGGRVVILGSTGVNFAA